MLIIAKRKTCFKIISYNVFDDQYRTNYYKCSILTKCIISPGIHVGFSILKDFSTASTSVVQQPKQESLPMAGLQVKPVCNRTFEPSSIPSYEGWESWLSFPHWDMVTGIIGREFFSLWAKVINIDSTWFAWLSSLADVSKS